MHHCSFRAPGRALLQTKARTTTAPGARLGLGLGLLLAVLLLPLAGRAQALIPVASYTLASTSGTYTPLATAAVALSGGSSDDGAYNGLPLGFTFYFQGQPFTSVSASTDGFLVFGQNVSTSYAANTANRLNSYGALSNVSLVAPLWDDLSLDAGGFYYATSGTAPNRVFTAEWRQAKWSVFASAPGISFQVRLLERTNQVQLVYRQEAGNADSQDASIGLSGSGSNFDYLSLSSTGPAPTTSSTAETTTLATKPATGQTYTFSAPRPAYTFAARTGTTDTYTPLATAAVALSGGSSDDGAYNGLPLGFTFTFRGQPYTTASASTNGWLTFGQSISNAANANGLTTGAQATRPLVAPLWDDLSLDAGDFYYATSGTAPNRVFTAEWRQARWDYRSAPAISFQVKLFEGSNRVWFLYRPEAGTLSATSSGASIGLSDDNGYFLSLNNTSAAPTASSTTENNNLTAKPALNQIYAFAPVGTANGPLPVELTAFTATPAGPATVRLAWATATEKNSQAFEVQRSTDGERFVPIGTVPAAGTSSAARPYALTDAHLPAHAATLYYRLKQVDADGTFSYSPVRTAALTGAAAGLSLYPNPAHGAATLTGAQPGAVVTVYDALGRPVASVPADASGTAALALPGGLPAGVYLVRAGTQARRLTVE